MADDVDLNVAFEDALKVVEQEAFDAEYKAIVGDEPAEETKTEEKPVETKSESSTPVPTVDWEAKIKAEVDKTKAEYENLLKTRVDLSQVDEDTYFELTGKDKELFFKKELFKRASEGPLKEKLKSDIAEYEKTSATTARTKALEAQIEKDKTEAAARAYREQYTSNAKQYVDKLDEKVAPTIFRLAKNGESDWVLSELMAEVSRDAQERFAKGESGEPISAEEAVKRIESRYARIAKVFSTQQTSKDERKPAPVKDVNVKVPETKKKTFDEEIEQGIEEALKEYMKLEKARGRQTL